MENRQEVLKEFLLKNCVGKDNKKTFKEIQAELLKSAEVEFKEDDLEYYHSAFKKDIQTIRKETNLYVCSDCKGYWIPQDESEHSNYLIRMAETHIITCLKQGVSKNRFYKLLNDTQVNNVSHHQQVINNSEVKRYGN